MACDIKQMRCRFLIFLLLCGMAVGGELVSGGLFTAWTGTTPNETPTGWTVSALTAIDADTKVTENPAGQCQFIAQASDEVEISQASLTIGTAYRIRFDIITIVSGDISLGVGTNSPVIYSTSGTKEVYITCIGNTTLKFYAGVDSVSDVTIDNVSVVAIDGMQAYVGGTSASATHAGWANTVAGTAVNANGANLYTANGLADTLGSGGKMLITTATDLTDITGVFVNIETNNGTEGTGRYEIINVDTSPSNADTILVNLDWIDDATDTVDITIGGAVPATYNAVAYDLEDVLDSSIGSAASNNVTIYDYLLAAQEITEEIKIDTNGGVGVYRKSLIGCDSSYIPLSNGSYTEYMDDNDDATGNIFEISVANITLKNIAATSPAGSAGTPDVSEYCFSGITGINDLVFENCYAERGYRGFSLNSATGHLLLNCRTKDNLQYQVYLSVSHGTAIIGGEYVWGSAFSEGLLYIIYLANSAGILIDSAVISGGAGGIYYNSAYGIHITNCLFYSQSISAIYLNGTSSSLHVLNNAFFLDDGATDYAIYMNVAGKIYEDYNITNCDTTHAMYYAASGKDWLGANSVSGLSFTFSDPYMDPANNDYKPNRGQTIADTYLIEKGWLPFWNTLTNENPRLSIGPFPTYDLPAVDKVDSSDTVFGVTGTAAGGSGIKVHPGMTGGIGG